MTNTISKFHKQAKFLREASGSTDVEKALRKALKVLATFDVPHFVCGGFAVQERGWARFTADVDIIVPDITIACEKLVLNGFLAHHAFQNRVTDSETSVDVYLFQGGKAFEKSVIAFPLPQIVSEHPQILPLVDLITLKLSSYLGMPVNRARDLADVVELMKANHPPRKLSVAPAVQDEYLRVWDGLFGAT